MLSQNGMTAILVALLVFLIILLIYRLRKQSKRHESVRRLGLQHLSELLESCSQRGDIADVAGRVSDLLKDACGCEVIVFLRKRRGSLICNYSHGIAKDLHRAMRMPFTRALSDELRKSSLPRPVLELRPFLPEPFSSRLAGTGADLCFPIYWRENLYGVYFIKSNQEVQSPAFCLIMASLAQVLSAAYHIKWHEAKREMLTERLDRFTDERAENPLEEQVLLSDLLRYRNSETIVPQIMSSIKRSLGLKKVVYLYRERDEGDDARIVRTGPDDSAEPLPAGDFERLFSRLGSDGMMPLNDLRFEYSPLDTWREEMCRIGYSYVAPFSLSEDRTGILAVGSEEEVERLSGRIKQYHHHAVDLVANAESYERIEELSYTDNLTGLANRRYLRKRLDEELSRARRYERHLAVILFDLDQLKIVNDRHGHQAGDAVLRCLGQTLQETIRSIDIVARYGGDEFCVVMPEADQAVCSKFMERLQRSIGEMTVQPDGIRETLGCTISLGGAIFPEHGSDPDRLIYAADMALLQAKERGRDQAVLYSTSQEAAQD